MMQLKSSYQHSIQLVSPYNAQDSNYHPFISEFVSKKEVQVHSNRIFLGKKLFRHRDSNPRLLKNQTFTNSHIKTKSSNKNSKTCSSRPQPTDEKPTRASWDAGPNKDWPIQLSKSICKNQFTSNRCFALIYRPMDASENVCLQNWVRSFCLHFYC